MFSSVTKRPGLVHFDEAVLAVVVGTDLYSYLWLLLRIVLVVHVSYMITPLCNLLIWGVLRLVLQL